MEQDDHRVEWVEDYGWRDEDGRDHHVVLRLDGVVGDRALASSVAQLLMKWTSEASTRCSLRAMWTRARTGRRKRTPEEAAF